MSVAESILEEVNTVADSRNGIVVSRALEIINSPPVVMVCGNDSWAVACVDTEQAKKSPVPTVRVRRAEQWEKDWMKACWEGWNAAT